MTFNVQGGWQEKTLLLAHDLKTKQVDILLVQETHLEGTLAAISTDTEITNKYAIIHNCLTLEEKIAKWTANKIKALKDEPTEDELKSIQAEAAKKAKWTNSEGMAMLVRKSLLKYFQVIPTCLRTTRIMLGALRVFPKSTLLIANVYAPVDAKENNAFWPTLDHVIKKAVNKLKGTKITKLIAGDFNTTFRKVDHVSYGGCWVNRNSPTCKAFIHNNKLADAVTLVTGKNATYTREIPYTKPHLTRNFITRSRIDHIFISQGKTSSVITAAVESAMATHSDHHGVLVRISTSIVTRTKSAPYLNPCRVPRLNTRNNLPVAEAKKRILEALNAEDTAKALQDIPNNASAEVIESTIYNALKKELDTVTTSPSKYYAVDSPALKSIRTAKKKVAACLSALKSSPDSPSWKLVNTINSTYKVIDATITLSARLTQTKKLLYCIFRNARIRKSGKLDLF
jgi:exonuclease III